MKDKSESLLPEFEYSSKSFSPVAGPISTKRKYLSKELEY